MAKPQDWAAFYGRDDAAKVVMWRADDFDGPPTTPGGHRFCRT